MGDVFAIVWPVMFGVVVTTIIGTTIAKLAAASRERRRFLDAFAGDPEITAVELRWRGAVRLVSKGPSAVSLECSIPSGNSASCTLSATAPRFAERTSLRLAPASAIGALLQPSTVRIGDDFFDHAMSVRGSEPEVVRALLAKSDVRSALLTFFGETGASSIDVKRDGCTISAHGSSPDDAAGAKRMLKLTAAILAVLDDASASPALPASSGAPVADESAVSSSSGTPIAVPIDLDRR